MSPRHWWRAHGGVGGAHSSPPSTRITEVTSRTMSMLAQLSHGRAERGVGGGVGDHHELGVGPATLLADGLDGDVVVGERVGDRGEHTGAVVDVDRHVVARAGLPHRLHRAVGVRRLPRAARPGESVAGDRHQVAEHGAGGGRATGPGAVEHQLPGGLGLHEDRVVGLADTGQRVRARDHRRVHARGDLVAAQLADREQLDHRAHVAGAGDVGRGHLGDALAVDVGRGDARVEGQAGQDRGLGGGVEPLDVGGRVGLGVAELLGLLQRLGEPGAGGVHLVEDEVGGAVDDAQHPGHLVAGQRLAQGPQDRDRTRDRGLVVEVALGLGRRLEERRPVLGQQRLVGGDDAGAVVERGQDQGPGRLDAADDLDDQVDVVAGHESRGVGGQQPLGHVHVTRRVEASYGDADELDRRAHAGGQVVVLLAEQPHHLRADRTAAEHRHLERALVLLVHETPTSVANRSDSVSRRSTVNVFPSRTPITGGRSAWL